MAEDWGNPVVSKEDDWGTPTIKRSRGAGGALRAPPPDNILDVLPGAGTPAGYAPGLLQATEGATFAGDPERGMATTAGDIGQATLEQALKLLGGVTDMLDPDVTGATPYQAPNSAIANYVGRAGARVSEVGIGAADALANVPGLESALGPIVGLLKNSPVSEMQQVLEQAKISEEERRLAAGEISLQQENADSLFNRGAENFYSLAESQRGRLSRGQLDAEQAVGNAANKGAMALLEQAVTSPIDTASALIPSVASSAFPVGAAGRVAQLAGLSQKASLAIGVTAAAETASSQNARAAFENTLAKTGDIEQASQAWDRTYGLSLPGNLGIMWATTKAGFNPLDEMLVGAGSVPRAASQAATPTARALQNAATRTKAGFIVGGKEAVGEAPQGAIDYIASEVGQGRMPDPTALGGSAAAEAVAGGGAGFGANIATQKLAAPEPDAETISGRISQSATDVQAAMDAQNWVGREAKAPPAPKPRMRPTEDGGWGPATIMPEAEVTPTTLEEAVTAAPAADPQQPPQPQQPGQPAMRPIDPSDPLSPLAPETSTLEPGVTRDQIMGEIALAQTDDQRTTAAARLAAFNQQEAQRGTPEGQERPRQETQQEGQGAPAPGPSTAPQGTTRLSDVGQAKTARRFGIAANGTSVVKTAADIAPDVAARNDLANNSDAEGFFDEATGQVYVIEKNLDLSRGWTVDGRRAWVVAHEGGHRALRAYANDVSRAVGPMAQPARELAIVLDRAGQNDTISMLASRIAGSSERATEGLDDNRSTDEALAEAMAAVVNDNYSELETRYGVQIPQAMRRTLKGFATRLVEKIRNLFRASGSKVSDSEVYELLTQMRDRFDSGRVEGLNKPAQQPAEKSRDVEGDDDSAPITASKRVKETDNDRARETAKRVIPNLTEGEVSELTNVTAKKLTSLLRQMPKASDMAASAWAGRSKRGWYASGVEAITSVFGPDAPRFAGLLAAMSPQIGVEGNLFNALNTWKNWVTAGRPQDRYDILEIMRASVQRDETKPSNAGPVLDAWVNNSVRALTDAGEITLSGPKVDSFMRNLLGDVQEVTNDAWMSNWALIDQTLFAGKKRGKAGLGRKGAGYLAMSARVREAAKMLSEATGDTWTPAEVQETVWSFGRTLSMFAASEGEFKGMNPDRLSEIEILERGLLTQEMISGTPDFGTLLQTDRYGDILKDAGYGNQLETLSRKPAQGRGASDKAEPGTGREASPFAEEDQRALERQAAERLEARRTDKSLGDVRKAHRQRLDAEKISDNSDVPFSKRARNVYTSNQGQDLAGLPSPVTVNGERMEFHGFKPAQDIAAKYQDKYGPAPTQYVPVDEDRAKRIADAYDKAKHDPSDPEVKAAYKAMINETLQQYEDILETGLEIEFITGEDPYAATPRMAILDVVENNHLWVFPTEGGFGSSDLDVSDNPLLAETKHKISGKTAVANDIFRVVHDYFGHIANGVGFRADGEENAWREHASMYSPLARRAMTSETRGQNSWVNFGPSAEFNRTASGAETKYADQKTTLLPEWVSEDGRTDKITASKRAKPFYSAMTRSIEQGKGAPTKASADQWKGWLDGAQRRGEFKQAERDWLGVDAMLDSKDGKVSKDDLLAFARANEVDVTEALLGKNPGKEDADYDDALENAIRERVGRRRQIDSSDDFVIDRFINGGTSREELASSLGITVDDVLAAESDAIAEVAGTAGASKFSQFQLPGGTNYRELLLTLPSKVAPRKAYQVTGAFPQDGFDSRESAQAHIDSLLSWFASQNDNPGFAEIRKQLEKYPPAIYEYQTEEPKGQSFASSHFDQPNILAHARFNERTDADGKRVLFIEEIQSDWHQKGRKDGYKSDDKPRIATKLERKDGYWEVTDQFGNFATNVMDYDVPRDASEARVMEVAQSKINNSVTGQAARDGRVPDAPFKKEWPMLAFKRMVRWAAENGFDSVAWTTGEQQAERYDLSKQVKNINVLPGSKTRKEFSDKRVQIDTLNSGSISFNIDDAGIVTNDFSGKDLKGKNVSDIVGKEIAERILAMDEAGVIEGDGLKIGGSGMRGFYDKILPAEVNKWAKAFGGKVGQTTLGQAGYGLTRVIGSGWQVVDARNLPVNDRTFRNQQDGMRWIVENDPTRRQHAIDLTPAMRDAAMAGLPMFSKRAPSFSAKKQKADAVSITGVHYSNTAGLNELDPRKAGTAASGRERRRFGMGQYGLRGGTAARLGFYVWEDGEAMPKAEDVVSAAGGKTPYMVNLTNLYDLENDPLNLSSLNADAMEEEISDAGYDGFVAGRQPGIDSRVAIVFDIGKKKIPVVPASGGAFSRRPRMGITDTNDFKRWFYPSVMRGSLETGEGLKPIVFYHGTYAREDFDIFDRSKAVYNSSRTINAIGSWFADVPENANIWAGAAKESVGKPRMIESQPARVMPVYLKITNPMYATAAELKRFWKAHAGGNDRLSDGDPEKFRAWMKQMRYDGIVLDAQDVDSKMMEPGYYVVALEPNQIKSAVGNNGDFDPANPSIVASRRTPAQAAAQRTGLLSRLAASGFPLGSPTQGPNGRFSKLTDTADRVREELQDKMLRARRLTESVTTQEVEDFYTLENMMFGKVRDTLEQYERDYILKLQHGMKRLGVSMDQMSDYLLARHAPERNRRIASINPAMPDAGSGLTTADAQGVLAGTTPGPYSGKVLSADVRRNAAALSGLVDAMRDETLTTLVASGRITPQLEQALRGTYQYYVPLRGKEEIEPWMESGPSRGRGLNVGSTGIQRAGGRGAGNLPLNIVGEMVGDLQRAAVNAGKAEVLQSFLKFAMAHPMPGVYTVEPVDLEWKFDKNTGEAYLGVKRAAEDDNRAVLVPYKGNAVRIRFEDERLARAMTNLGQEDFAGFVKWFGKINRWRSAVLTRYNPGFAPVNIVRDAIFGLTAITAEQGVKAAAETVLNYGPAFTALLQDSYNRTGDSSVPDAQKTMADWSVEYAEQGVKTGMTMTDDVIDLQKRLSVASTTLMQLALGGKPITATKEAIVRGGTPIVEAIEHFNDASENAIRLAVYVSMRQRGDTKMAAAKYAKNVTINFNRKGFAGPAVNAIFLFYNAAIQGSHAVFRVMKKPAVLGFLSGLAGLQYMAALAMMGDDDDDGITEWDKVPKYVKETSLVIPVFGSDGKSWISIPMPYGFNLVPYGAGRLAEWNEHGSRPTDGSLFLDMMNAGIGAFSPIPINDQKSMMGDTIGFLLQLASNKDDLGRQITNENPWESYDTPDALKGRAATPKVFVDLSQAMAKIGGGDLEERKPPIGWLNRSPEELEQIYNFAAGGLGNIGSKSVRWWEQFDADGMKDPLDYVTAAPIASRFVGQAGGATEARAVADRYYGEAGEFQRHLDVMNDKIVKGEDPQAVLAERQSQVPALEGVGLARYKKPAKPSRTMRGGNKGDLKISHAGKVQFTPGDDSPLGSLKAAKKAVEDLNGAIKSLRGEDLTIAQAMSVVGGADPSVNIEKALGLEPGYNAARPAPNRVRTRAIKLLQEQRQKAQQEFLIDLEDSRE